MEAAEHDALAEGTDDPFAAVPADGGDDPLAGPDPDLVQPGELGGENPSEGEQEQLADPLDEEPLGEGDIPPPGPGEALTDPEEEAEEEPEPAAEPEPEPEPAPEPDDTPEEPTEEELAADAKAEAEAKAAEEAKAKSNATGEGDAAGADSGNGKSDSTDDKDKPKSGGTRRRRSRGAAPKKGERKYVVVECDKDDKPLGVVHEGNHRSDKDARKHAFEEMRGQETAHLVAVPARYWNVKTLTAEEETVRKVKEK